MVAKATAGIVFIVIIPYGRFRAAPGYSHIVSLDAYIVYKGCSHGKSRCSYIPVSDPIRIDFLADHPEAIPVLKGWFEDAWAPYYGPEGPGDALADLRNSCRRDGMPIAIVALAGDEVVGTAALKAESVGTHPHLTPWLAALLVGEAYRGRGIAERLIAAVEDLAREQAWSCLYVGSGTGSGTPEPALTRRGWEHLETVPYYVGEVSVFRKEL